MSNEDIALQRRRLLRGGALLAGAVAVTGAGTTKAETADGDQLTIGEDNTGTRPTTLTIGSDPQNPTLGLTNGDGPSLRLSLGNDWEGALGPGEIANTYAGPYIGVSDGPSGDPITTYLATGLDHASLPVPLAYETPDRALDTRTASGRARVLASSSSPYTIGSRLKAGAWLNVDIGMGDTNFSLDGAFLNATSIVLDVTGVSANRLPGSSATAALKRQTVRRGSAAVKPKRLMRSRATR